jgi:hypothetical protein
MAVAVAMTTMRRPDADCSALQRSAATGKILAQGRIHCKGHPQHATASSGRALFKRALPSLLTIQTQVNTPYSCKTQFTQSNELLKPM